MVSARVREVYQAPVEAQAKTDYRVCVALTVPRVHRAPGEMQGHPGHQGSLARAAQRSGSCHVIVYSTWLDHAIIRPTFCGYLFLHIDSIRSVATRSYTSMYSFIPRFTVRTLLSSPLSLSANARHSASIHLRTLQT